MLAANYSEYKDNSPQITSVDFAAIQWCITWNPGGLSDRSRRVFQLFATAIRMKPGAIRIVSTVGEIARAIRTANLGDCSPSTVRRALAELEGLGYLRRRRASFGPAHHQLTIDLVVARWSHWSRAPKKPKCPTSCYISPRQSMGPGEDRTSTKSRVNTCNNNINSSNPARARANNSKYDFLACHPVLLTLWVLLRGTPDVSLYNRAERECRAEIAGVEVAHPSGVPWPDYERHWTDMLPEMRDTFAKTQILPRLRRGIRRDTKEEDTGTGTGTGSVAELAETSDEIRERILRSLSGSGMSADSISRPAPEIDWSDPDMRALELVRARTARRGIDRE